MLVGGANKAYKSKIPESWIAAVKEADVLLCQREIPEWVNIELGKHAKKLILDCGGSLEPMSDDLVKIADVLSPNMTERQVLIGKIPEDKQHECLKMLVDGHRKLSILSKEGSSGATLITKDSEFHGDAF